MNKPAKDLRSISLSSALGTPQEAQQADLEAVLENMTVDPTAMLRRLHGISITNSERVITAEYVTHTVKGRMGDRLDEGTGAVSLTGLIGFDWANAIKAAETQAKRRLTSSLLGYGFQGTKEDEVPTATPGQEPIVPEVPQVNNAPADVVADTRTEVKEIVISVPASVVVPFPSAVELAVPVVTEAALSAMHTAAQKLDKPTIPQTEAPAAAPKPAPAAIQQAGFFDEEPLPVPPGVTAVIPEPVAIRIQTSPIPEVAQASAVEPAPVQDIIVEKPVTDKPSKLQYQALTARCTKLVRDVLPKAGKDAGALLLPYIRKSLGTNELQNGNLLVWEETLARLEAAPNPAALLAIIKGGK